MKSQAYSILAHLRQGRKISSKSAWELFGVSSLHRRLSDLRVLGWVIDDHWHEIEDRNGKCVRIKVYSINKHKNRHMK